MAQAFKPTVRYTDNNGKLTSVICDSYAEVKRRMKAFMQDSFDENVSVYRSRRGEWGEYYEKWVLVNGKPKITKQGWQ